MDVWIQPCLKFTSGLFGNINPYILLFVYARSGWVLTFPTRTPQWRTCRVYWYLLVADNPLADALQLGVADITKLVMGHGLDVVVQRHEPPTVLHEDTVIGSKGLEDLRKQLMAPEHSLGGREGLKRFIWG